MTRLGRLGPALALGLLLLGLVPWADLIAGGHELERFGEVLDGWWSGTLLAAGIGTIYAFATRRWPEVWPQGGWERWSTRLDLFAPRRTLAFTLFAFAFYALVAHLVFDRRPLLIDEVVQIWQARLYVAGHLWAPSTGLPEFFGSPHLVDDGIKVFSQFPAGGPAMLALGALLNAEWLVGPAFGALAVWATAGILRALREPIGTATAALLLATFAPFVVFMSGSHMNHVPTLAWTAVGLLGVAHLVSSGPSGRWALVAGAGLGLAASVRPVDGFAFAAPVGLWLLWRVAKDRSWLAPMLLFGVAAILPVAADLWVNLHTTGDPFLFGYRLLWGPAHDPGFHQAPWGPAHTPTHGLELLSTYLVQLQTYFLETPFPALLPMVIALTLAPKLETFDRLLLISSVLVMGFYFAYWHDGFFLGPRFLYQLVPLLALWTARAAGALRRQFGEGTLFRAAMGTWSVGLLIALSVSVPIRAREYRGWLPTTRWPAEARAAEAGVKGGLVLVRESFGAEIIVRMWALGLSRADTEFLFHSVDACRLFLSVELLERAGIRGEDAAARLRPLSADSAILIPSPYSPDRSQRFQPGSRYPEPCIRRIESDRRGFTGYPSLLLVQDDNVWARDLHARDTVLLSRYPDRPVWLLLPPDTTIGTPPEFRRVDVDSLRRTWPSERDTP